MKTPTLLLIPFALSLSAYTAHSTEWNGPVPDSERYLTSTPFTYIIGYDDWLANEQAMQGLRDAPPDLLHVNSPIPLDGELGMMEHHRDWNTKIVSRDRYREIVQETTDFVRTMHDIGIETVIPYINSSLMLGDHERRLGFWKIFDRWDELEWLRLGPKPALDPLLWCGVPRRSLDPWKPYPEYDLWRYEPSLGDPSWRMIQKRIIEELAACGYDGVFIDDCIMESYAPVDEERFLGYVANRPSHTRLPKHTMLGRAGQGLRYAETVRYWADTTTEYLGLLRDAGKRVEDEFFVLPNVGSIGRPIGLAGRERGGKSLPSIRDTARLVMLEENYASGLIAPGVVYDYALQYKQCLALGIRPALLPYASGSHVTELQYAEAAAGGGGAFAQLSTTYTDLRNDYRNMYRNNSEVFGGLRPWSQVALVYDTDELHFMNGTHIHDGMKTARALLDAHVQFDVVLKRDLLTPTLHRYETVFLPDVHYLSEAACKALLAYVERGGTLVATGTPATHDELGRARPRHAWGLQPYAMRGLTENVGRIGEGRLAYVRDIARLLPATSVDVELFSDVLWDGIEETRKNLVEQRTDIHTQPHPIWKHFVSQYTENHLSTDLPPEVRVHVYRRDNGLITVHLVRYCISPWEEDAAEPPKPLSECRVTLTLDRSGTPKGAYGIDARNGRTELLCKRAENRIVLETQDLGYHRVIVLPPDAE